MTAVAHPPKGEAKAWVAENVVEIDTRAGKSRQMFHADQVEAAACLGYQAGWRRGWCAARGLPYPEGLTSSENGTARTT